MGPMRSTRAHATRATPDHATGFHRRSAPLRRRLADVAWASIRHGLAHHRSVDLTGQAFPPRLLAHQSAFVTLHRGDTLRLELASRIDLLRMDPSEGYAQFDMPVPPYPCRNTVHFGGDSWIEVTQVPVAAT